ncbi:aspartate dehydrogenase [Niveispirillum cyanobacteriorum]|uniref:L-aspartate dehydrogenase n=1 Tax=Niveispirillum cyanobacteriorum TaxID=1612173 RepID=A0A2K9NJQ4_9PROT|nr:aspartate dehydrogenase [Niveispirillum cyanobacteriorum]AUN33314.1 aspartate dehydrogenase [Niveispirillum cyanobacteriorum]GGE49775.1 putative L-aspartate dehydrogenase [Niveispirillum cyanobacteriorum]
MVLRVGIAGYGTIGAAVGRALDAGMEGLTLTAVTSGDAAKARTRMAELKAQVPVVDAATLAELCDIIVECAPTAAFADIALPALARGRTLVTVSGAALLQRPDIIDAAGAHGGRIILATGALLGFDAVRAAAEGTIHSVTMVTRKPPTSLTKAKEVVERGLDLLSLTEPLKLFDGSAREGAARFPANVNVAAALGLAGIGPDRTQLQIWADPSVTRNCHRIVVDADSARLVLEIENVPTVENPGTGRITALSLVAAVRGLTSAFRVGS